MKYEHNRILKTEALTFETTETCIYLEKTIGSLQVGTN